MNDSDFNRLRLYDKSFLKRLKLLKLPLQERVSNHISELTSLNENITADFQYFKSIEIDEKILADESLSSEFINYIQINKLVKPRNKKEFKEPAQPITKYVHAVKNLQGNSTLIQFQFFLRENNLSWESSSTLIIYIEKFIHQTLKRHITKILNQDVLFKLEKEVEKNDVEIFNRMRSIRRFLFLNAVNNLAEIKPKDYKKSKLYKLISNYNKANLADSNKIISENLGLNHNQIQINNFKDKDLLRMKVEFGIEQFAFKYFEL